MTASSSDAERSPKKTTPTEARTGDKQRDSKDENEGGESGETEETKAEDEHEKEEAACHWEKVFLLNFPKGTQDMPAN